MQHGTLTEEGRQHDALHRLRAAGHAAETDHELDRGVFLRGVQRDVPSRAGRIVSFIRHATYRRRRTDRELRELDGLIVAVLQEDNPQSVRHVFYRMVSTPGAGVDKTDNGYNLVQRRCCELRRSGAVPYGWISDATRRGYHVDSFGGGGDLIAAFAGLYRVNIWDSASTYVEVWTESRSMAGVIENDCRELGVSLYPAGGFTSWTLAHQAAQGIEAASNGRAVRIVYVGDYDPAGVLIDLDIIAKLRGHLPDLDIEEIRVAVTEEQAAGLPSKPRKATERRRREIRHTVEAEAMPARELRAMLRAAVEEYLPADALAAAKVAEDSEREGLAALAGIVQRNDVWSVVAHLEGTA